MQSYNFFVTQTNKSLDLEENAQKATRKIATRIVRKTTRKKTMKGRGKQRGKQHKKTRQQDKEEVDTKIYTFPIKIRILLAYLEKILYLCGIFFAVKK